MMRQAGFCREDKRCSVVFSRFIGNTLPKRSSYYATARARHRPANLRFTSLLIKRPCARTRRRRKRGYGGTRLVSARLRSAAKLQGLASPPLREFSRKEKHLPPATALPRCPSAFSLIRLLYAFSRGLPFSSLQNERNTRSETLALIKSSTVVRVNELTPPCFSLIR